MYCFFISAYIKLYYCLLHFLNFPSNFSYYPDISIWHVQGIYKKFLHFSSQGHWYEAKSLRDGSTVTGYLMCQHIAGLDLSVSVRVATELINMIVPLSVCTKEEQICCMIFMDKGVQGAEIHICALSMGTVLFL